jgi:hypothetical protein
MLTGGGSPLTQAQLVDEFVEAFTAVSFDPANIKAEQSAVSLCAGLVHGGCTAEVVCVWL